MPNHKRIRHGDADYIGFQEAMDQLGLSDPQDREQLVWMIANGRLSRPHQLPGNRVGWLQRQIDAAKEAKQ